MLSTALTDCTSRLKPRTPRRGFGVGLGFRVWGLGLGVAALSGLQGLGVRAKNPKKQGLGRSCGLGVRVQDKRLVLEAVIRLRGYCLGCYLGYSIITVAVYN